MNKDLGFYIFKLVIQIYFTYQRIDLNYIQVVEESTHVKIFLSISLVVNWLAI
jgi:hypothetical protein